ncbi:MAG: hypothetical protein OEX02_01850 [Cyclobacteriaceae bacterium]|nr:hypothetical protein [Cyclobacteriaceae bacterium]MDH5599500.1 hypothetical protein [Cyclobacteriaceae bacterium]
MGNKSHRQIIKARGKITWHPDKDPEWEDREAFLKLSDEERWAYLMRLIMHTKKLPEGAGKFTKRIIEWN